ncbi:MAG: helix-turn-helix transcriptional regulator [Clostridiales bacterium]|nr:helix-turn-helix transcriptional regulator [Clostridiales bacterium]
MEYLDFVRKRITELRLAKGIPSERELSRRLGKNELYIQHILSGKHNIGLSSFFDLCAYFEISPQEFFDPNLHNPTLVKEALAVIERLPDDDIRQLMELAKKLNRKDK